MPCNRRKDLVSDSTNIVQALLQRCRKKPHLARFQWKVRSKAIYAEQQLHMYIKYPLCLYTFVYWNPWCCPPFSSAKPLAGLGLFPGAHGAEAELLTETLHSGLLGHISISNPFIITEPNPVLYGKWLCIKWPAHSNQPWHILLPPTAPPHAVCARKCGP